MRVLGGTIEATSKSLMRVRVAIIDLGFIDLTTAQAAGELDNVVYTHDYTGDGLETYTEHGTGVAEIVADMAPRASLYLLMIGDSVDLQNATNYCITNGIDIINHSVGWYDTNFYDGTGTVADINEIRPERMLFSAPLRLCGRKRLGPSTNPFT